MPRFATFADREILSWSVRSFAVITNRRAMVRRCSYRNRGPRPSRRSKTSCSRSRRSASSGSVALARIWLLGPGDSCATCRNAPVCPSHEQCLHLAASAIRPLHGSVTVDSQLLGAFRRSPIGAFKVGAVVAERRAVIVADATSDPYIKRPEWVREEGIQSFGGQPLLYREHVLGVLGVFLRMRLSQSAIDVLRVLANHAAAAIASARAFEEIARLQTRLQRENEYLREVVTSHDDFTTIVGSSPAIYHVKRQ